MNALKVTNNIIKFQAPKNCNFVTSMKWLNLLSNGIICQLSVYYYHSPYKY